MIYDSYSENDTFDIAYNMAKNAQPGTIIALVGDLGVGKTAFTKGFAEGLDIEEPIVSPTFTFLQSYEDGRMPLYHFDVYRISDFSEMDELGYEDCFDGDGVTIMEWADLVMEIIPAGATHITISKDLSKGVDYRRIEVLEL